MIKYGLSSFEKKIAKELWLHCFSDSLEYTNYYFENIFSISKFLFYINEQKEILSGLNENSYCHNFNGNIKPINFIVGAGTFKEHRNLGVFSKLLTQSLKNSFERGEREVFLIPATPELYKKFGFQFTHFLEKYSFENTRLNSSSFKTDSYENYQVLPLDFSLKEITHATIFSENFKYFEECFNFYKKSISKFNSTLLETQETFFKFLHELYFETGVFYTVTLKNKVVAVFSLITSKNNIDIKDIFFNNQNDFLQIINFINIFSKLNKQYETTNITAPLNSNFDILLDKFFISNKTITPFIMMRIINVKLSLYDFFCNFIKTNNVNSFHLIIEIKDNIFFENNGYFHINYFSNDNSLTVNKIQTKELENAQLKTDFSCSIHIITLLLYGAEDFSTLFIEKKIELLNSSNLIILEQCFIKKINYIHKYV